MSNKALVVIDIQNDITKHYRDIIDNINAAIEWAVAEGMHVVYIKHNNVTAGTRTFKPGTKGEELVPEMKVMSDNIFVKTKSNALTSEAFSAFIAANGINEFYVAGADATGCVKSTCFNMTKAGYTVHVLSNCVTSYDLKKVPEMLVYYESKGCEVKKFSEYKNYMKRILLLFALLCGMTTVWGQTESKNMNYKQENNMKQKFCQSCGMPLTDDVLGTNADGTKNEDYCMYCYKDGQFLQDCTMEEMIEHCAQFVNAVNEGLEKPITKEEYIGMMKSYFPQLKRWRQTLDVNNDEAMKVNPALAGIKELIAQMADKQPIAYISSVDHEGFPWTKAMLSPRVREGIKIFYFTTNTFSLRVAHYKANPKASIYFCDAEGFKGMMLKGTMEVLTDAKSKEMIWRDGDEQYYPGGVTDPNYCVLKFTATDGRFYSDFYPRSFVIE